MSITKRTRFIVAIGIQIAVILGLILIKFLVLSGGTEVLLRLEPFDPTSPLRGDYLTFQLSDLSIFPGTEPGLYNARNGQTVYALLEKTSEYWGLDRIQLYKPSEGANLYLKGKITSGGRNGLSRVPYSNRNSNLHVIYGIEEYFIPEGKGRDFDFWNKTVVARVVIDDQGNAVLKGLEVEGKPWP